MESNTDTRHKIHSFIRKSLSLFECILKCFLVMNMLLLMKDLILRYLKLFSIELHSTLQVAWTHRNSERHSTLNLKFRNFIIGVFSVRKAVRGQPEKLQF